MSRIGFLCSPAIGHLNPAIAVAHCLQIRGHQVTFFHPAFHRSVAEPPVLAAGLKFNPLPESDIPYRRSRKSVLGIGGKLLEAVEGIERDTLRVFSTAPRALSAENIDAVVADQASAAAGTVAEYLHLPHITLSFFPPLFLQDCVPPANFGWRYSAGRVGQMRNWFGNKLVTYLATPLMEIVNHQRRAWELPELHHLNELSSRTAIVAQLPRALDFPRPHWPSHIFHAGPFCNQRIRQPVEFPWERLDGKPLIYASMGTIQNDRLDVFHMVEQACVPLDTQLVLSLGGGSPEPGAIRTQLPNTIVRSYVPQLELLRRAHLTITHAGLNTTLESLSEGVPLVAIPVSADQPGVAARIEWAGCGIVVPLRQLSVRHLRGALTGILQHPQYRAAAHRMQNEITSLDGPNIAADTIERVIHQKAKAFA
jgi:MGT family glycosyltransferase